MNYSLDNLGQFGALNDLAPSESPPNSFSSANNVRFKDGYAERVSAEILGL
jgi:hypothetical protein